MDAKADHFRREKVPLLTFLEKNAGVTAVFVYPTKARHLFYKTLSTMVMLNNRHLHKTKEAL